ncbi:VOC family protein [Granulicella paludicola]|uniref:VOC family protein n=1 Tax=Granulicella paludicola TaxID=474951 RepID=UPI0021DFF986|nr:VOC family protein [Granulicella paludicola]
MRTNLHLVFPGSCTEAFAFYETVFQSKSTFKMTYGEAPAEMPTPEGAKDLVMHTAMPLGSMTLMGCDAPPHMGEPKMGGFHISVDMPDEDEVRRIFAALSEGGSVQMPLTPTFWTPLFGMCKDKFGVEWMVSVPGPEM